MNKQWIIIPAQITNIYSKTVCINNLLYIIEL